ncbi:MAG: HAD family phosphatase [Candidatus Omnitrophica bacterium]|nr:HAD family phosphatase [Candidatus Omnitrophota bacterium]
MAIRAILFDLGNVLVDYEPNIFLSRLHEYSKISTSELMRYFLNSPLDVAYTEGKISSEEFFETAAGELGLQCGPGLFRDFWCDIFSAKKEMEELVGEVKKNYPVWALSNTNEWHFEFLRPKFGFLSLIDKYFLSFRLKCQKPDPKIYEQVIRSTGFEPNEIFFVDDLETNVKSARAMGLRATVFRSARQLKQEFSEAGILI